MADLSDRRIHPAWKERQTHANPGDLSRSGCDRPRRVLHVVTSLCTGGLSTYLLNVIANIDPLRYETHLACTHFEGPHLQEGRAYAKSVAVLSASRQPGKILRLRQLMHQLKPDVVH